MSFVMPCDGEFRGPAAVHAVRARNVHIQFPVRGADMHRHRFPDHVPSRFRVVRIHRRKCLKHILSGFIECLGPSQLLSILFLKGVRIPGDAHPSGSRCQNRKYKIFIGQDLCSAYQKQALFIFLYRENQLFGSGAFISRCIRPDKNVIGFSCCHVDRRDREYAFHPVPGFIHTAIFPSGFIRVEHAYIVELGPFIRLYGYLQPLTAHNAHRRNDGGYSQGAIRRSHPDPHAVAEVCPCHLVPVKGFPVEILLPPDRLRYCCLGHKDIGSLLIGPVQSAVPPKLLRIQVSPSVPIPYPQRRYLRRHLDIHMQQVKAQPAFNVLGFSVHAQDQVLCKTILHHQDHLIFMSTIISASMCMHRQLVHARTLEAFRRERKLGAILRHTETFLNKLPVPSFRLIIDLDMIVSRPADFLKGPVHTVSYGKDRRDPGNLRQAQWTIRRLHSKLDRFGYNLVSLYPGCHFEQVCPGIGCAKSPFPVVSIPIPIISPTRVFLLEGFHFQMAGTGCIYAEGNILTGQSLFFIGQAKLDASLLRFRNGKICSAQAFDPSLSQPGADMQGERLRLSFRIQIAGRNQEGLPVPFKFPAIPLLQRIIIRRAKEGDVLPVFIVLQVRNHGFNPFSPVKCRPVQFNFRLRQAPI